MPKLLSEKQLKELTNWPPKLLRLDANNNLLPDECWRSLADAERLVIADVASDVRSNGLPLAAWTTLRNLKRLRYLRTNATKEDISRLESVPNLTSIVLVGDDQRRIAIGPSEARILVNMSRCDSLYLFAMNIDAGVLETLGGMSSLARLSLVKCIIDPSEQVNFRHLQCMKRLELPGSNISRSGVQSIGELRNLELLNLAACDIDDAAILQLAHMRRLSAIRLGQCPVSDRGISVVASLPQMTSMELQSTQLSDNGLRAIVREGRVQSLGLRDTQITTDGIKELAALPSLNLLDLSDIDVDATTLRSLQHAPELQSLLLVHCDLDDQCLESIASISHLESLDISQNPRISDTGLKHLVRHPGLKSISIDQCNLENSSTQQLKQRFDLVGSDAVAIAKPTPAASTVK
jgi:Leucine-rich repeat (LRR) protein